MVQPQFYQNLQTNYGYTGFYGIAMGGKIIYAPQPKQRHFHEIIINRNQVVPEPHKNRLKILYGGAAKGGKSVALRWEGHRICLNYPGARGLLIRSSFPELRRTHLAIDKLYSDFPDMSSVLSYNQSTHIATYKNGSTLEFGFGENEADFGQYLGAEYDFIMVDELTTIKFDFVIKLISRLFSKIPGFTPFFAAATNPGSVSHKEVKSYFIDKDFDIEYPDMLAQGKYNKDSIYFVPATVHDNQIGIEHDPSILTAFEEMSELDRQRFYYGNWDIFEGQFFTILNRVEHEIEPSLAPTKGVRWLSAMDYGNYSAAYAGNTDATGNIYVHYEWIEQNKTKADLAISYKKFLTQRNLLDVTTVGDTDMFAKPAKVYGGDHRAVKEFTDKGLHFVKMIKAIKDDADEEKSFRRYCNKHMLDLLQYRKDVKGLYLRKPRLRFLKGRCPVLWKTMPYLITSPKDDRDVDKESGVHHPYDALKYLCLSFSRPIAQNMKSVRQEMEERIKRAKERGRI